LKPIVLLKRAIFAAALIPAAALIVDAFRGRLTANPIDYITDTTGDWALRLLIVTLCITPLRRLTRWNPIIQLRRMLGLFSFFYGLLHVSTYTVLDQGLDWPAIWVDVTKRKFIFVGVATFVLLVPLALTSTSGALKRLGYARWKRLHRLAYVAPLLGVIHFIWRVKRDVREPIVYGTVLGLLLLVRLGTYLRLRLAASTTRVAVVLAAVAGSLMI